MKLFAGGSKSITDIVPLPNRRVLDEAIYYHEEILVGDGPGADEAIQAYLAERKYEYVTVYASGNLARCNLGNWDVKFVMLGPTPSRFDLEHQKDIQMAMDCDRAVMAWDGKSLRTRLCIIELMALGKHVDNLLWRQEKDEWYDLNGSIDGSVLFRDEFKNGSIRIWLDDSRIVPMGFLHCRSVSEAKLFIEAAEWNGIAIEGIHCDYDLGMYSLLGGNGTDLLCWLVKRDTLYPVAAHAPDPEGQEKLNSFIGQYWKW